MVGCQGNPYGDNWATWNADFFTPAASAPRRRPVAIHARQSRDLRSQPGRVVYLPRPASATNPPVSDLPSRTSRRSAASRSRSSTPPRLRTRQIRPQEAAEYARQFDLLDEITPPGSWLVTHRPVWGILAGKEGEFEVENAAFEAATGGSLKADFGLVLSGHIHVAESIAFDEISGRAPQLISGNAGTALDDIPTASPTAGELGDPTVTEAETLSAFGFMTLEPDARWVDRDPARHEGRRRPRLRSGPGSTDLRAARRPTDTASEKCKEMRKRATFRSPSSLPPRTGSPARI